MIDITQYTVDNEWMLMMRGSIDIETVDELRKITLLSSVKRVHIDFEEVEFMDSTGIGWLLHFVRELQKHYERVRIVHPSEDIREMFDVVEFAEIVGEEVIA
ncbi:STAS domain-containing protein [Salimicrobium halophilum]|uniref:Anti-sigma B factor antagonist n=1 Tax=Salimicrobium halophilum TaxID=86666 RepID=A0A1G8V405_9BACI|nr:STAS domain-containing protein [Salimicrobium halophilum]SDJ60808.1 anti-sigma B factor antagonist [Salimicrobium halophilum]